MIKYSAKIGDNIFSVEGASYIEFTNILAELYGEEEVEAVREIERKVRDAFNPPAPDPTMAQAVGNIQSAFPGAQPANPPWQQQGAAQPNYLPNHTYAQNQQQNQYPPRASAGAPPGQAPACPMHGQPARWVNGRNGGFWGCSVDYRSGCKVR